MAAADAAICRIGASAAAVEQRFDSNECPLEGFELVHRVGRIDLLGCGQMREDAAQRDFRKAAESLEGTAQLLRLDPKPIEIGVHFHVHESAGLAPACRAGEPLGEVIDFPKSKLQVCGYRLVERLRRSRPHHQYRRRDSRRTQGQGLFGAVNAEPRRERLDGPGRLQQPVPVGVTLDDEGRALRPDKPAQHLRIVAQSPKRDAQFSDHAAPSLETMPQHSPRLEGGLGCRLQEST